MKNAVERYEMRVIETLLHKPGLGVNELLKELTKRYNLRTKNTLREALKELCKDGTVDYKLGKRNKMHYYLTENYLKEHKEEINVVQKINELKHTLDIFESRYYVGISKEISENFNKDFLRITQMLGEIEEILIKYTVEELLREKFKDQLWNDYKNLEKRFFDILKHIYKKLGGNEDFIRKIEEANKQALLRMLKEQLSKLEPPQEIPLDTLLDRVAESMMKEFPEEFKTKSEAIEYLKKNENLIRELKEYIQKT